MGAAAAADEAETPPASPPSAARSQGNTAMAAAGSKSNNSSRGRKRSRKDDDDEVGSDGNEEGNKFSEADGRKRKARKAGHNDEGTKKASAKDARSAPAAQAVVAPAKATSPVRRRNAAKAPAAVRDLGPGPAQRTQSKPRTRTNGSGSNGLSGAAAFRAKAAASAGKPRSAKKQVATAPKKSKVLIDPNPSVISTGNENNNTFTSATKSISDLLDNPATIRKWLKILALVTLIEAIILVGNVYIGAHMEHKGIENATSTQALYTGDHRVCGRVQTSSVADVPPFMTFASAKRARLYNEDAEENGSSGNEGVEVVHCGQCGKCSTTHDMTILAQTTQTLTNTARECSVRGFLGSFFLLRGISTYRSISHSCMETNVGFTPPCLDCWLDNMVCGVQKCLFTCLKSQYIDWDPKNHDDGRINRCYQCDEKMCGPAFLECSGTNRRRQGIRSDLSRDDDKELCRSVDVNWNRYTEGEDGRQSHSFK